MAPPYLSGDGPMDLLYRTTEARERTSGCKPENWHAQAYRDLVNWLATSNRASARSMKDFMFRTHEYRGATPEYTEDFLKDVLESIGIVLGMSERKIRTKRDEERDKDLRAKQKYFSAEKVIYDENGREYVVVHCSMPTKLRLTDVKKIFKVVSKRDCDEYKDPKHAQTSIQRIQKTLSRWEYPKEEFAGDKSAHENIAQDGIADESVHDEIAHDGIAHDD